MISWYHSWWLAGFITFSFRLLWGFLEFQNIWIHFAFPVTRRMISAVCTGRECVVWFWTFRSKIFSITFYTAWRLSTARQSGKTMKRIVVSFIGHVNKILDFEYNYFYSLHSFTNWRREGREILFLNSISSMSIVKVYSFNTNMWPLLFLEHGENVGNVALLDFYEHSFIREFRNLEGNSDSNLEFDWDHGIPSGSIPK